MGRLNLIKKKTVAKLNNLQILKIKVDAYGMFQICRFIGRNCDISI